ncbi:hypothetical protein INR49_010364 [Caranx melampygus]|nr:hypothetical protein INR49_010364 [Caranx melampygus]
MGSEKDSESPHSSVSGVPNPKCRAPGKRQGRISFHSLFHSKRGSGAPGAPKERRPPPPSSGEANLLECPLCLVCQPADQLPELLGCSHRSCLCCLRQYLRIEITESRVQLSCPECAERLAPRQVADILDDPALLEKYEEFLLRRCLASDPDCRWCPAPDCLPSSPQAVPAVPGWCVAERAAAPTDDIKPCPRCGAYIIKMNDGSCNHMTCAIHAHYELKKTSRHRRNLAITGGVALSIITAPVIAAVSVGIGVPIMLAYVYGVVPISLCRGGGCGVSRGKGRGVRIDFDEDDGPITVADAWRALKSPSLGESSLDGAVSGLSTTSPSEGLSVAPGTLGDTPHFNTLAGGALGSRTGKYSRLEVQAGELAKESAQRETGSLGAGSDCASTRGMAGSIISSYTLPDRECTNLEIQRGGPDPASGLCCHGDRLRRRGASGLQLQTGGALSGSALGLSPGMSIREGLRDVTLAQPESIRSDLEMSDTQSDDIAELTSDDCDSPHPKSCHLGAGQQQQQQQQLAQPPSCRALNPSTEGLHCPADSNVILYV